MSEWISNWTEITLDPIRSWQIDYGLQQKVVDDLVWDRLGTTLVCEREVPTFGFETFQWKVSFVYNVGYVKSLEVGHVSQSGWSANDHFMAKDSWQPSHVSWRYQHWSTLLLGNFIFSIHSIDVVPSIVVNPLWFHTRVHNYDQDETFLFHDSPRGWHRFSLRYKIWVRKTLGKYSRKT